MNLHQLEAILQAPGKVSTKTSRQVIDEAAAFLGSVAGRHKATGRDAVMDIYIMQDRRPVIVVRCNGLQDLVVEQDDDQA